MNAIGCGEVTGAATAGLYRIPYSLTCALHAEHPRSPMAFIAASPLRATQAPRIPDAGGHLCNTRLQHVTAMCAPPRRIRKCTNPSDADIIHDLITQLAVYEKQPDAVKLSADDYRRDGFQRDPPLFFAALAEERTPAEEDWRAIGLLLCYWKYSTWQGRALHIEDIFVVPERRRQGVGRELFTHAVQAARAENAARLELSTFPSPPPVP